MGLDGVELVMEVENEFGISIPDADAEAIKTVGSLYVYLCTRVSRAGGKRCASRETFIRTREALTTLSSFQQDAYRPRAKLADCVSLDQLSAASGALADRLQLKLPRLNTYSWRRFVDNSIFGRGATVRRWIEGIHDLNDLPKRGAWNDSSIWRTLQQIVSEQFRVPRETITPVTHFIRDLGM